MRNAERIHAKSRFIVVSVAFVYEMANNLHLAIRDWMPIRQFESPRFAPCRHEPASRTEMPEDVTDRSHWAVVWG